MSRWLPLALACFACGQTESDRRAAAEGGSGGAVAGSGGVSKSGSGGASAASSGGTGGAPEAGAGGAGEAGGSGSGGLATGGAAGAPAGAGGGDPPDAGCVPVSASAACGARECGAANDGCSGFHDCGACDLASECSPEGACLAKPECDCDAAGFACGRLPEIMGCPVEVLCGPLEGRCPDGQLCVEPNDRMGERICLTPNPDLDSCDPTVPAPPIDPDTPCCSSPIVACQTAYYGCGRMYDLATGEYCGGCSQPNGRVWFCGPGY